VHSAQLFLAADRRQRVRPGKRPEVLSGASVRTAQGN